MLKQLIRPFAFLGITHPDGLLGWVRWWLPLLLSVLLCVLIFAVPKVDIYGMSGVFAKLLNFVQSLPGFYLAALAAISTFESKTIDKLMPGIPPQGSVLYNGYLQRVELTRRRMLCMLFAYLTALSFSLTLILIFMTSFAEPLVSLLTIPVKLWLRGIGLFCVFFLFLQMLVITTWGLFYLGEKIHTPEKNT